jgi:uncharacterized Zn-binding protein involved in type VI secretion
MTHNHSLHPLCLRCLVSVSSLHSATALLEETKAEIELCEQNHQAGTGAAAAGGSASPPSVKPERFAASAGDADVDEDGDAAMVTGAAAASMVASPLHKSRRSSGGRRRPKRFVRASSNVMDAEILIDALAKKKKLRWGAVASANVGKVRARASTSRSLTSVSSRC